MQGKNKEPIVYLGQMAMPYYTVKCFETDTINLLLGIITGEKNKTQY